MGVAGRILGIIGSILMMLGFAFFGLYMCCVFGGAGLMVVSGN
jgi:hypothetical protein